MKQKKLKFEVEQVTNGFILTIIEVDRNGVETETKLVCTTQADLLKRLGTHISSLVNA